MVYLRIRNCKNQNCKDTIPNVDYSRICNLLPASAIIPAIKLYTDISLMQLIQDKSLLNYLVDFDPLNHHYSIYPYKYKYTVMDFVKRSIRHNLFSIIGDGFYPNWPHRWAMLKATSLLLWRRPLVKWLAFFTEHDQPLTSVKSFKRTVYFGNHWINV